MQKKNVLDTPLHLRNIPVQTMQDKEELCSKDLAQFTPADRETGKQANVSLISQNAL